MLFSSSSVAFLLVKSVFTVQSMMSFLKRDSCKTELTLHFTCIHFLMNFNLLSCSFYFIIVDSFFPDIIHLIIFHTFKLLQIKICSIWIFLWPIRYFIRLTKNFGLKHCSLQLKSCIHTYNIGMYTTLR